MRSACFVRDSYPGTVFLSVLFIFCPCCLYSVSAVYILSGLNLRNNEKLNFSNFVF